ncbi:hypothetical protein [Streptomyces lincolnensis]|uniref:hypothetical protein n=1 Tax=Streptomyces lincolnensis TaxID=1915 RepID=UPI0027E2C2EB|nr:hypothetical protein [Streptomyces lincolnensis]
MDEEDWRRATKITAGGCRIGGVSDLADPVYPPDIPAHIAYYLAVDDVERRTEAAVANGARLVVPPFDAGDQGRMVTLIDPVGAAFSLWGAASLHRMGRPARPGACSDTHGPGVRGAGARQALLPRDDRGPPCPRRLRNRPRTFRVRPAVGTRGGRRRCGRRSRTGTRTGRGLSRLLQRDRPSRRAVAQYGGTDRACPSPGTVSRQATVRVGLRKAASLLKGCGTH